MTNEANPVNLELLRTIAGLMDDLLQRVTGLNPFARKQVVYYTIATHAINSLETFPLLVLKGPQGTGKSCTLHVIAAFAYNPHRFSLRARTLPTIRDELKAAHDGTAIIEEADQAWKDSEMFERMISDRYQRETAQAALKESDGDGGHHTIEFPTFGATVLHRRLPFADTALNGRSVSVRFRAMHNKTYAAIEDIRDLLAALNSSETSTYRFRASHLWTVSVLEFSIAIGRYWRLRNFLAIAIFWRR